VDLTLSDWVPIGSDTTPFAGIFDGDSYTITLQSFATSTLSSGYYSRLGIFAYVEGLTNEARAELKNLKIVSSVSCTPTTTYGTYAGLLAGQAKTANISGITLSGSLGLTSSKNTVYAGGVVGYSTGDIDIINCHNNCNITTTLTGQTGYFGGIIGSLTTGLGVLQGSSKIEDCSSTGNMNATTSGSNRYAYVGGIVASITGKDGNSPRIIKCWAEGTLLAASPGTSGQSYAGGIAGGCGQYTVITQSYFNGKVVPTGTRPYAGGIAGSMGREARIEDCWSHGEVTSLNLAGGIVGIHTNPYPSYIVRCYSTAEVKRTAATENDSNGAGGISGVNRNTSDVTTTISNCVALNSKITGIDSTYIHRVVGRTDAGVLTDNNYAWSGIVIDSGSAAYTPDKTLTGVDGADVTTEQLIQSFYEGLGWTFTTSTGVWQMDTYGYPMLQWQAAEIVRTPLAGSGS
jgi:hypothetical protein